jgi:hypothetical protein
MNCCNHQCNEGRQCSANDGLDDLPPLPLIGVLFWALGPCLLVWAVFGLFWVLLS